MDVGLSLRSGITTPTSYLLCKYNIKYNPCTNLVVVVFYLARWMQYCVSKPYFHLEYLVDMTGSALALLLSLYSLHFRYLFHGGSTGSQSPILALTPHYATTLQWPFFVSMCKTNHKFESQTEWHPPM